jgi:hypothetical protein
MRRKHEYSIAAWALLGLAHLAMAQVSTNLQSSALPSAPMPQTDSTQSVYKMATGQQAVPAAPQVTPGGPTSLTLKQAEAIAIKNNPQISV